MGGVSQKPPKRKHIKPSTPSVNNYFLTVPSNDIMLQNDDAVLARTPGNLRRSNSSFSMTGELFGRKFSTHRRSVENL
jgi:hypothetical protein